MIKKYELSAEEKELKDNAKAREIIKEIMDFGVSQGQILQIIYLLSLELENTDHMQQVSFIAKNLKKEIKLGKLII